MKELDQKSRNTRKIMIRIFKSLFIFWSIFIFAMTSYNTLTTAHPTCGGMMDAPKCSRWRSFENSLNLLIPFIVFVVPVLVITTPLALLVIMSWSGISGWVGLISGLIPAIAFYRYSAKRAFKQSQRISH
jgi:hypothetical protein